MTSLGGHSLLPFLYRYRQDPFDLAVAVRSTHPLSYGEAFTPCFHGIMKREFDTENYSENSTQYPAHIHVGFIRAGATVSVR